MIVARTMATKQFSVLIFATFAILGAYLVF